MKNINDVCVIIQARLSSERVPEKMIKSFGDSSLFEIGCRKLKESNIIPKENIYVSVYEQELIDIAKKCNMNIFYRSKKSINSESESLSELYDWYDKLSFKYVILLNACNPLLRIETIDSFIQKYLESDKDGMFGVTKKKNYYWDKDKKSITDWKDFETMNTKIVDPTYEAAHCLYASRMDIIGDGYWMDNKYPPEPELFMVDELESFDIDYNWQFEVGEILYKKFK
jgi:CMP-N-acetylneuraminic acid synthetase